MAKDSGSTSTTVQSNEPPAYSQPYLKDVLSQGNQLYNSGAGFNPWPGSTVVPFSEQTQGALGGIEGMARQGDTANLGATVADFGKTASGQYLGGRNPYFEENLNKQSEGLATDVQRNVDLMGRRGSGYNVNEVAGAVGDFRNKALQDNYNSERGYQMQAAGMAPGLYQAQYAPAERLASVGAQMEDQTARQIQDQVRLFEGQQSAPWNRLANYAGLTSGAGSMGGSSSTTVPKPTNYAAPLGGAIAGAQLGSMFMPGIGTGIGALAGGGLGLLGLM
jgi:hypothetical protein